MSYKLSICIPTYNREKYLKQLLNCILNQLKDIEENVVEICVSDNASTDNTQQMLQQYLQKYNNITYFRWDKNMGADMNYLKVVEIAHGEYCWFFGSDDLMVDGAIKKILEEIKENYDIYLCNRYQCDSNMKIISNYNLLNKNVETSVFKFENNKDIIEYLKKVEHLEGFFSYLSSIIFKREQWNFIEVDKIFIGTCYSLTYVFLSLLKKNIKLKYIKDYLALYRGENDSLANEGAVRRLKLDFDGYKKLFTIVFENDEYLSNYYKIILRKFFNYFHIVPIFVNANDKDKNLLISVVKDLYSVKLIYFLSFFYKIYINFFRGLFKKLNVHKVLVKVFINR